MYFVVYKDNFGEWRWHLKASNGRILADSGEGYKSRTYAIRVIHNVMAVGSQTPIKETTG